MDTGGTRRGRPGTVVLLGGVGLWPGLFEALAAEIERSIPGVAVVRHRRVGYDGRPPARDMGELMDDVRSAVSRASPPVTVYGELGGATLALAVALDPPIGLDGVVAHEPLLGPLEPELHEMMCAAASELTRVGPVAALEFVKQLLGPDVWAALPDAARCFAADHAATIAAEVPHFAGWAPGDLRFRAPLVTTVGRSSPPAWRRVALILRDAGAGTDMTRGGHLASLDDPEALGAAVRRVHAR